MWIRCGWGRRGVNEIGIWGMDDKFYDDGICSQYGKGLAVWPGPKTTYFRGF